MTPARGARRHRRALAALAVLGLAVGAPVLASGASASGTPSSGAPPSPATAAGAALPRAAAPTAPTDLRETAKSRTSVSLAWTAPSSTEGSPITHDVVVKTGVLVASLGSAARAATVTGLSADTTYHFTVKAENAVGISPPSGTVAVTTTGTGATGTSPPAPPSVPGYDLVGADGGVFAFPPGNPGGFYGSLPGLGIHVGDVVGAMATT